MKTQTNLFFDNSVSEYFNGKMDLYLGDIDFRFADEFVNITAEIKTISNDNKFTGKKLSFNQAREYACDVDILDDLKRIKKNYLFEYHKYTNEPYVIIVPFKKITGQEKIAIDFLDLQKAKMLYVKKESQFNQWLSGNRYIGIYPRKELLVVNYK
jgi:hypothetical protein